MFKPGGVRECFMDSSGGEDGGNIFGRAGKSLHPGVNAEDGFGGVQAFCLFLGTDRGVHASRDEFVRTDANARAKRQGWLMRQFP
jgi:hypothetical protein